jgi:diguanylate cyclase (GGDEF)-like protein
LFLDLDRFKAINDSFGHMAADRLLGEIAARLLTSVRAADTVSRQGGDEFLILLSGLHHADEAAHIAEKILRAVSAPLEVDGHFISASFSIGVSLYPIDGTDFSTLLRHADTALYHAKESGRNTYRFFTEEMNVANLERMELEGHLRHAIEASQLSLHYQPQVDLYTGQIVGAEALLRWNHPQLGEVPPSRFIPVAEASGLIIPIGAWVINEVCRQLGAWRTQGPSAIRVAVNLSAVQFRRNDIVQTVESALSSNGVHPSLLEIEITESVLLHEAADVQRNVRALKTLGVRLAIDDFGMGYSSFAYLKRFAVDKLKIDRSFVQDVPTDVEDAAIIRAIAQLGQSLELTIVAEGVENHAQASFLRECACHNAQGYLYSRPVPPDWFAALFTAQASPLDRPEASAIGMDSETRLALPQR